MFTTKETNLCKFFALLFMIFHHLFNAENIPCGALVSSLSICCKVCVAIFLILSGYGLCASFEKSKSLHYKDFTLKHLKKIYINYWFAIVFSLAIGILFFKQQLFSVITPKPIFRIAATLSGVQYLARYHGFNASWWYISVCVLTYLLFPMLNKLLKRNIYCFIVLTVVLSIPVAIPVYGYVLACVSTFMIGMVLHYNKILTKLISASHGHKILLAIAFVLLSVIRAFIGVSKLGIIYDNLYAIIAILSICVFASKKIVYNISERLSKYNFDMYLLHMFVTNIYFKPILSNINNTLIIYVLSTAIVIALSSVSVFIKKRLRICK